MRFSHLAAVLVGTALWQELGSARAATLFINPAPELGGGGWCSPCEPGFGEWRVWDRFTLARNARITSVGLLIHDISGPGGPDLLNVSVWNTSRTEVLHEATLGRTAYSATFLPHFQHGPGWGYYDILAPTPGWGLSMGDYYLSVFGLGGTMFGWSPTRDVIDGSIIYRSLWDGRDYPLNSDAAFTLFGDEFEGPIPPSEPLPPTPVPEPTGVALLATGLTALVARRVRRRRRT